jgi:tetratricopeptide (TPR) repeat protein
LPRSGSDTNLASTYREQGRWEEAKKLFIEVMEACKTRLGADHPSTLTGMANLASTYLDQARWEEAEKLLVQVMETSKTKLGADHPNTLPSWPTWRRRFGSRAGGRRPRSCWCSSRISVIATAIIFSFRTPIRYLGRPLSKCRIAYSTHNSQLTPSRF